MPTWAVTLGASFDFATVSIPLVNLGIISVIQFLSIHRGNPNFSSFDQHCAQPSTPGAALSNTRLRAGGGFTGPGGLGNYVERASKTSTVDPA